PSRRLLQRPDRRRRWAGLDVRLSLASAVAFALLRLGSGVGKILQYHVEESPGIPADLLLAALAHHSQVGSVDHATPLAVVLREVRQMSLPPWNKKVRI